MINRSFFLFSTAALLCWSADVSIASDSFPTYTQHTPIGPEPASLENSFQVAAICFLGGGNCGDGGFSKGDNYEVDNGKRCLNEGFVKKSCNSAQIAEDICPYDSSYVKACICKSEYQYTSSNCKSPRSVSGNSCDGKYTSCNCPTGVSSGAYGCKEYYAAPCGSVCKNAYTDNCHKRTAVSTPYGCMNYFSDCLSKCERAYPDNCRNRISVSAPYGCQTYYSDCQSKCQIAHDRPICKVGYIYYMDGTCVAPENYTSSKTALGIVAYVTDGGKHGQIMATKYIGSDRWASQDQSSIYGSLAYDKNTGNFGTVDVPDIKNYPSNAKDEVAKDFDSCGNTDKIMTYAKYFDTFFREHNRTFVNYHNPSLLSMFPAAEMTRNYAPTSATKGKWCLPSAGILKNIYDNREAINTALGKLNGEKLYTCHAQKVYEGEYDYSGNCQYWSSNEVQYSVAWYGVNSGLSNIVTNTYYGIFIWPVLDF